MENQRGGVLFIILIALALFASLSYAVTSSTRSGGGNSSRENNKLIASQIMQYVTSLRAAITRAKLDGCTNEEISFENTFIADYNRIVPVPDTCKIFSPAGQGVPFQSPSPEWLLPNPPHALWGQYRYTGRTEILGIGTDSLGANSVELIFVVPWIKPEICQEINSQNSIPPNASFANFHWSQGFKGTFGLSATVNEPNFFGKSVGCGGLILYAVLIER